MSSLKEKLQSIISTCNQALKDLQVIEDALHGVVGSKPADPTPKPLPEPVPADPIPEPKEPEEPPDNTSDRPEGAYVSCILGSVWGDAGDEHSGDWQEMAYPQFKPSNKSGIRDGWISLPARVPAGTVGYVRHVSEAGEPLGSWVGPYPVADVGPWFDGVNSAGKRAPEYFDYYWRENRRPKVETQRLDDRGRKHNGCAIDLTPKAMADAVGSSPVAIWERAITAYLDVVIVEPDVSDDRITEHFTWAEFEHSDLAIANKLDNTVPEELEENVVNLCTYLLEPLRKWAGGPIHINSGYRSLKLDALLHKNLGSPQSKELDHTKGVAADVGSIAGKSVEEVFYYIRDNLEFDRLVYEGTHVHVSYNKGKNRGLVVISPP